MNQSKKAAPIDHDAFNLAEGLRSFERQYIEHSRIAKVLEEVREVISLGPSSNEAICLHVSGPPGVGKSTIRSKLAKEFAPVKNGRQFEMEGSKVIADYVPLIQIEMPNNPSVISVCYAILEALGETELRRTTEALLSHRVSRCLRATGTSAILVDEAQRAVDKNGIVAAEHLFDWFKWVHARHGVSLIFLGLGRLRYLFDQDSQLARRWNAEIRLEGYWWKNKAGADDIEAQEMFIGILAAYKRILPIPMQIDVENPRNAFRFFFASQGLIGPLKKLLREAIRIAARFPPGDRSIRLETLEMAFDRSIRRGEANLQNPFSRQFTFDLPPTPVDDGLLLPPPATRRAAKKRRARRKAALLDILS